MPLLDYYTFCTFIAPHVKRWTGSDATVLVKAHPEQFTKPKIEVSDRSVKPVFTKLYIEQALMFFSAPMVGTETAPVADDIIRALPTEFDDIMEKQLTHSPQMAAALDVVQKYAFISDVSRALENSEVPVVRWYAAALLNLVLYTDIKITDHQRIQRFAELIDKKVTERLTVKPNGPDYAILALRPKFIAEFFYGFPQEMTSTFYQMRNEDQIIFRGNFMGMTMSLPNYLRAPGLFHNQESMAKSRAAFLEIMNFADPRSRTLSNGMIFPYDDSMGLQQKYFEEVVNALTCEGSIMAAGVDENAIIRVAGPISLQANACTFNKVSSNFSPAQAQSLSLAASIVGNQYIVDMLKGRF